MEAQVIYVIWSVVSVTFTRTQSFNALANRNIPLLGSLYLFDLCALSALYVLVFKKDPFR